MGAEHQRKEVILKVLTSLISFSLLGALAYVFYTQGNSLTFQVIYAIGYVYTVLHALGYVVGKKAGCGTLILSAIFALAWPLFFLITLPIIIISSGIQSGIED